MPQANADEAKELAKNSSDCSILLTHLNRQKDGCTVSDARNGLKSILNISGASTTPLLRASVVGWYGTATPDVFNPSTGNLDGEIQNRAACLTESTLAGLRAYRDLFEVKYGIAFDRDDLFSKGANPCLNISDTLLRANKTLVGKPCPKHLFNFIPEELQPFVNVIHGSFDATHEREWRYPGDLGFNLSELKFVFCPEDEFHVCTTGQTNGMPCLFDLAWLDRV